VSILLGLVGADVVIGARILGLFPFPLKSHFTVTSALMRELANRGHQVTVCNPFPEKSPGPNYTNIDTEATREELLREAGKLTVVS
jgi:hypothetical protein